MSSIWTPEGERPVRRDPVGTPGEAPSGARSGPPSGPLSGSPSGSLSGPALGDEVGEPTEADLDALRAQLAETPVASIVANHCVQLYELAALHLSLRPPQLGEAAVAIDALGALVEGLSGRLGEDEGTLHDALAQLRIAYVQIKGAATGGTPPADGVGPAQQVGDI